MRRRRPRTSDCSRTRASRTRRSRAWRGGWRSSCGERSCRRRNGVGRHKGRCPSAKQQPKQPQRSPGKRTKTKHGGGREVASGERITGCRGGGVLSGSSTTSSLCGFGHVPRLWRRRRSRIPYPVPSGMNSRRTPTPPSTSVSRTLDSGPHSRVTHYITEFGRVAERLWRWLRYDVKYAGPQSGETTE